jgi:hypothetical protein
MRGSVALISSSILLAACSGSDPSSDGATTDPGRGAPTAAPGGARGGATGGDAGFRPDTAATGLEAGTAGIPNPGGKCVAGGTPMKLPGTGVGYCVKASPSCATAGARCPLYVTINTNGWYFARVDDAANGPLITVELYTETDGTGVKDKMAELPRVIAKDWPGLDPSRIYAIGWSAGSGAVSRGLCHVSKRSDFSSYGTTSDVYAAVVGVGGCGCANDYAPLSGNWHAITWNGMLDQFNGGDSCEAGLRKRAAVNGCANAAVSWEPVGRDDRYARNGDGSRNAEKLDFGPCTKGDVIGYRFADEGHVVSAKKHFDPKISAADTVWNFLQGKSK